MTYREEISLNQPDKTNQKEIPPLPYNIIPQQLQLCLLVGSGGQL